nr:hypothetical protein [Tanacetum cinerariifolium]
MTGNISYLTDFKEHDEVMLPLEEEIKVATNDESMLWHKRLGHINFI